MAWCAAVAVLKVQQQSPPPMPHFSGAGQAVCFVPSWNRIPDGVISAP